MAREVFDQLVAERPAHRGVDPALQVAGDVLDRFAHADLSVGGGVVDRVTAQLRHPGFERDPCSQRRLFEVHEQRAARQGVAVTRGVLLDVRGERQQPVQFRGTEIEQGNQVAAGKALAVHGTSVARESKPARV